MQDDRQPIKAYRRRRGISLSGVIVSLLCIVVLLTVTLLVLSVGWRTNCGPHLEDATHLRAISQSFHVASRDHDMMLPTPGTVRRFPFVVAGELRYVPGRGDEDVSADTTANLYAMMITQNYFTPDLLVSPLERNPDVVVKEGYDWNRYDPLRGLFWDESFMADLADVSHVSYAHLLLWGERKRLRWRDSLNADVGIVSSRGPKDGDCAPGSYTCDQQDIWSGHVVLGDGSVQWQSSIKGWEHLFRIDEGIDGGDPVLTFTLAIDPERGPTIQHD